METPRRYGDRLWREFPATAWQLTHPRDPSTSRCRSGKQERSTWRYAQDCTSYECWSRPAFSLCRQKYQEATRVRTTGCDPSSLVSQHRLIGRLIRARRNLLVHSSPLWEDHPTTDAARRSGSRGVLINQPVSDPNTRLKPNVSQKWLCATLAGMVGLGRSSTVVQTERKRAIARAASHRAARSIRTSGYKHTAYSNARNTCSA